MKKIALIMMVLATICLLGGNGYAGVIMMQPEPGNNDGTDDGSANAGKDTFTRGDTFQTTNFGDWTYMLSGSQPTGGDVRALIQFNTDNLPDTTQSAVLRLYNWGHNGYLNSGVVDVFRITEPWNEMVVTNDTRPTYDSTIYATTVVYNQDGWVEFDITSLYNEWKAGTPNYGLMLNTQGSGSCSGSQPIGDCEPGNFYASDYTDASYRPMLVVDDGLVAYYPFNGNANDESGHGNDGIVFGATPTIDRFGSPNSAYEFDRMGKYVHIGDRDMLEDTPELSICLWTKFSSLGGTLSIGALPMISKWYNCSVGPKSYILCEGEGKLWFYVGNGNSCDGVGFSHNIAIGEWYSISVVFDNGLIKIFLNGGLIGQEVVSVEQIGDSTENLKIGDWYYTYNSSYPTFDGVIDEVRIYNRALSEAEIGELAEFPANIVVSPEAYDFGNVEWMEASTTFISVSNTGGEDLSLSSIILQSGNNDFDVTLSPNLPAVLPPGGMTDIEITFSPSAFGLLADVLVITSDDQDEEVVEVYLSGVGVLADTPSEQIENVINFIEDAVDAGDLGGVGSGNSAGKRLNALINMIEAAGDLLEDGFFDEGCQQLNDVYKKTDGVSPPPDFVTGPAAEDLAAVILELMSYYGCE